MKNILISSIILDPTYRGRKEAALKPERVATLKGELDAGNKLDPVTLWDIPRDGIYPSDGWYRIEAHRQAGRTHIAANIRKGTWEEFLASLMGSNNTHRGLPLSFEDRQAKVILAIFSLPDWSTARISKHVGIRRETVEELRAIHGPAARSVNNQDVRGHGDDGKSDGKRQGADGKWYGPKHQAPQAPFAARTTPQPSYAGGYFVPPQAPRVKPDAPKLHSPDLPDLEGMLSSLGDAIHEAAVAVRMTETPAHEQAMRLLADLRMACLTLCRRREAV